MKNKYSKLTRVEQIAKFAELLESQEGLSREDRDWVDQCIIESETDTMLDAVITAYIDKGTKNPIERDYATEDWHKVASRYLGIDSKEEADKLLNDVRARKRVNDKGELYLAPEQKEIQQPTFSPINQRVPLRRRIMFRVAAVLIPLLVIGGAVWLSHDNAGLGTIEPRSIETAIVSFTTDKAEKITLPDGSEVKLKEGTTITYAEQFADNRKVTLEGEAYFTVTHDERHPFTVSSGTMKVTVLGTEFNIRTGGEAEVILTSGKVEITNGEQTATLVPGQRATLIENTRTINLDEVNVGELNRLRGTNLSFNGETLDEVFKMIGSFFEVEIVIQDKIELSDNLRIAYNDNITLDEALQILQLATRSFDYTIDQNTVTITAKR